MSRTVRRSPSNSPAAVCDSTSELDALVAELFPTDQQHADWYLRQPKQASVSPEQTTLDYASDPAAEAERVRLVSEVSAAIDAERRTREALAQSIVAEGDAVDALRHQSGQCTALERTVEALRKQCGELQLLHANGIVLLESAQQAGAEVEHALGQRLEATEASLAECEAQVEGSNRRVQAALEEQQRTESSRQVAQGCVKVLQDVNAEIELRVKHMAEQLHRAHQAANCTPETDEPCAACPELSAQLQAAQDANDMLRAQVKLLEQQSAALSAAHQAALLQAAHTREELENDFLISQEGECTLSTRVEELEAELETKKQQLLACEVEHSSEVFVLRAALEELRAEGKHAEQIGGGDDDELYEQKCRVELLQHAVSTLAEEHASELRVLHCTLNGLLHSGQESEEGTEEVQDLKIQISHLRAVATRAVAEVASMTEAASSVEAQERVRRLALPGAGALEAEEEAKEFCISARRYFAEHGGQNQDAVVCLDEIRSQI